MFCFVLIMVFNICTSNCVYCVVLCSLCDSSKLIVPRIYHTLSLICAVFPHKSYNKKNHHRKIKNVEGDASISEILSCKKARRAKIKRHSRYHVIDGAETPSSGRARLVSILYSSGTKRRQASATIYANINPAGIGAGSEEM